MGADVTEEHIHPWFVRLPPGEEQIGEHGDEVPEHRPHQRVRHRATPPVSDHRHDHESDRGPHEEVGEPVEAGVVAAIGEEQRDLDDDGDLHLVDRRKELILVSGFNVYPREVEDVLLAHPDVEEAAVLGIPHPYTGESVKALVVLRDGARASADDLIAHAARSLSRFKCPTAVEFVAELPPEGASQA
ncbi:MAG: hypothetical protein KY450_14780 [Actinobacteria bacterium]|nr:hypothetical protein [Actinomycetota bacterium]